MFDSSNPSLYESLFTDYDWFDFYQGAKERLPPNMPNARGLHVTMSMFVAADPAANKVN